MTTETRCELTELLTSQCAHCLGYCGEGYERGDPIGRSVDVYTCPGCCGGAK